LKIAVTSDDELGFFELIIKVSLPGLQITNGLEYFIPGVSSRQNGTISEGLAYWQEH
jgi:hypothetical protein